MCVVTMLGRRLRRRPNIVTVHGQRLMVADIDRYIMLVKLLTITRCRGTLHVPKQTRLFVMCYLSLNPFSARTVFIRQTSVCRRHLETFPALKGLKYL